MDKKQYEWNKALQEAAKKQDLITVEYFLRLGADPLGTADEKFPDEHILGELFCQASDDSSLANAMPQIITLFLEYGMNIGDRKIPADDGNNINPLWDLAFCRDENGLKMLAVLLEHDLDYGSAEELVSHIFTDIEMCDGCDTEDPWFMEGTAFALKMVMLTASYSHIADESSYIRECIEYESNRTDNLPRFCEWNNYEYDIDKSTCTNIPHGLQNASLTIRDKRTKEVVWMFRI